MSTATKKKKPAAEAVVPRTPLPSSVLGLLSKRLVCQALDCSPKFLELAIRAGEFPAADVKLGRNPRWSVAMVNEAIEDIRKRGSINGGVRPQAAE